MTFKRLKYLIPSIVWAVIIVVLSTMPSKKIPELWVEFFIQPDKIAHFGLYFIFINTLYYTITKTAKNLPSTVSKLLIAFISVFLFGILMELLQLLIFVDRKADILDVVSNVLGAIFGIFSVLVINNKFRKL